MKAETLQEQAERLAKFTCRMEENIRGSVKKFFLAEAALQPKQSIENAILRILAKNSAGATTTG